jgi:hypothetical protein
MYGKYGSFCRRCHKDELYEHPIECLPCRKYETCPCKEGFSELHRKTDGLQTKQYEDLYAEYKSPSKKRRIILDEPERENHCSKTTVVGEQQFSYKRIKKVALALGTVGISDVCYIFLPGVQNVAFS